MQPHWHEPRPLGDAQRVGLMQQQGAQQLNAMQQRQQLARARPQQLPPPPMLGAGLFQGVHNLMAGWGGGILGLIAGGAVGFYLGGLYQKRRLAAGNPQQGASESEEEPSLEDLESWRGEIEEAEGAEGAGEEDEGEEGD